MEETIEEVGKTAGMSEVNTSEDMEKVKELNRIKHEVKNNIISDLLDSEDVGENKIKEEFSKQLSGKIEDSNVFK